MKLSIITVVMNRVDTIENAMCSLRNQNYKDYQHCIIDGASTDGSLDTIQRLSDTKTLLVSEPDGGIYDALNKGFAVSSGEIIGILHSDDYYADDRVLDDVVAAFSDPSIDAVYGDIEYVSKHNATHVVRYWHAGEYSPIKLCWGWMPPHPGLFLRRRVIEQWGGYDIHYRISADYDALLRYFSKGEIRAAYLPRVLVKMRVGGESNRSLSNILLKSREDYQALRRNGVGGVGALIWKNLSKLPQFFKR